LDTILPEVTRHAFNLENYNSLWRVSSKETGGDYEFITTQMLDVALYLDYGDEVGRRKIFELLREILKSSEVPDEHLKTIVKLFRIISLDERDFTR
jgi:condensin complex subunit 3